MRTLFLVLSFILIVSVITSDAKAVNEYLQGYTNQCDQGSIEPYVEYNSDSTDYDNSTSYSDSIREGARVGIRFRFKFGSSCTDEHKKLMLDNEKLKQQLEVLKYCARYSGLELGDEFATIRKKCADVKKKESEVKDVSNESKLNR
tara:strand:+ start:373 stop:810 length:438 start_codon:yes stop_codon:yes gene_type:complete